MVLVNYFYFDKPTPSGVASTRSNAVSPCAQRSLLLCVCTYSDAFNSCVVFLFLAMATAAALPLPHDTCRSFNSPHSSSMYLYLCCHSLLSVLGIANHSLPPWNSWISPTGVLVVQVDIAVQHGGVFFSSQKSHDVVFLLSILSY